MEYEQKSEKEISSEINEGFDSLDYTFDMLDYGVIYNKIFLLLPQNMIMFEEFGLEKLVACEVICCAICHQINWDYLRKAVYRKTLQNPEWVEVEYLVSISVSEIKNLIGDYEKKERIQADERCKMIKIIAKRLKDANMTFLDIFMNNGNNRKYYEIERFFLNCSVFSKDPQQKKYQLLIQTLSDYSYFKDLSDYYKPAIDYHLIRLFLRRGVVRPKNKYAYQYVFEQDIVRRENTIAALRKVCSESLEDICWITSLNLKAINRIEWWIGRTVCINDSPDCELQKEDSKWLKKSFVKCPYYDTCYARKYNKNFLSINEPKYTGNSY